MTTQTHTYTIHSGMGNNPIYTDRVAAIQEWARMRSFTWASVKRSDGVWVATADGMVHA